jgi:hydrogenase nickel incorporation protein HypA/HybF
MSNWRKLTVHELYLAESILNIVKEYAASNHFQKVNHVVLSYGRFSCIEPKALEFAFDVQAKGTSAEGAVLKFNVLPGHVHCFACQKDSEVTAHTAICPACGADEVLLTAGTEDLQVLELDVD